MSFDRSSDHITADTCRDGVASVVDQWRIRNRVLPRKRYCMNLDLDAESPADAEPNAPMRALDL